MKICIIGKNSYIGNHIDEWLTKYGYDVFQLDVLEEDWNVFDFSTYDVVIQVAGIVHRPDCQDADLYKRVNTEMPVKIARKLRDECLKYYRKKTFVFLSTMAVFGIQKRLKKNVITIDTPKSPISLYAKSKADAEEQLLLMQDRYFDVVVVRPPNVYGKGCRGGYISGFVNVVKKLPIIPYAYANVKQSVLYIDNLCELIRKVIEQKRHGIFMPQDDKPVSAIDIIKTISHFQGKSIITSRLLGQILRLGSFVPIIKKAYGGVEYDMNLSHIEDLDYVVVSFEEGIRRTIN